MTCLEVPTQRSSFEHRSVYSCSTRLHKSNPSISSPRCAARWSPTTLPTARSEGLGCRSRHHAGLHHAGLPVLDTGDHRGSTHKSRAALSGPHVQYQLHMCVLITVLLPPPLVHASGTLLLSVTRRIAFNHQHRRHHHRHHHRLHRHHRHHHHLQLPMHSGSLTSSRFVQL